MSGAVSGALGATAGQNVVRGRLHELGLRGPPTGPRPSTLAHPAQLTRRQQEVLELMAEGLSNAEIAGRLYRATKTVDHHVSAVLSTLGVHSREEAAALAQDRGWLGGRSSPAGTRHGEGSPPE